MSMLQRKPWTLEEFLEWEERQELRYEFDGFQPVAMNGGTFGHETIADQLRATLRSRLRGSPCRVASPGMKVEVLGRIRYPDALVTCTPIDRTIQIAPLPVVVFEVLSPGTSYTDRFSKLREYQATPSIRRYVILEQDRIAAAVHVRQGDAWTITVHTGCEVLAMPEIGVELPLVECYADLDLPSEDAETER
jgi:Uma2 family endonuclease